MYELVEIPRSLGPPRFFFLLSSCFLFVTIFVFNLQFTFNFNVQVFREDENKGIEHCTYRRKRYYNVAIKKLRAEH